MYRGRRVAGWGGTLHYNGGQRGLNDNLSGYNVV